MKHDLIQGFINRKRTQESNWECELVTKKKNNKEIYEI